MDRLRGDSCVITVTTQESARNLFIKTTLTKAVQAKTNKSMDGKDPLQQ